MVHGTDKNKSNQLLLYKQFYSKQFNFPIDKIDVEFFIVKRKLYENMDFPQRRIQTFVPAIGTPSINKVNTSLKEFIDECFDEEGKHNEQHIYKKIVSTKNCKYCEFKDKPELCDRRSKLMVSGYDLRMNLSYFIGKSYEKEIMNKINEVSKNILV